MHVSLSEPTNKDSAPYYMRHAQWFPAGPAVWIKGAILVESGKQSSYSNQLSLLQVCTIFHRRLNTLRSSALFSIFHPVTTQWQLILRCEKMHFHLCFCMQLWKLRPQASHSLKGHMANIYLTACCRFGAIWRWLLQSAMLCRTCSRKLAIVVGPINLPGDDSPPPTWKMALSLTAHWRLAQRSLAVCKARTIRLP